MDNNVCCIYTIMNVVTKKFYIGSTLDFKKRKRDHLYKIKHGKVFKYV